MKLALLFASVALACPPPLNDFRFQDNKTVSTATLIEQALADPLVGAMDLVTHPYNYVKPWPRNPRSGVSVVEYCFADKSVRQRYKDVVGSAWMKWYIKIRDPSQASGHSLTFRPAISLNKKEPYCFLSRSNGRGAWNGDFPKDILIIDDWQGFGSAEGASATAGWNREDFMNRLKINSAMPANMLVTVVAHELGHVFGLGHEHQRPDRDRYVRFDCTRLGGYTQLANTPNKPDSMDDICKSPHLGWKYGFNAPPFSVLPYRRQVGSKEYNLYMNFPLLYDIDSLMHYGSKQGAASSNWWEGPLVKWKNGGPNFNPPAQFTQQDIEEIPAPTEPSNGDVAAIRYLYPW